MLFELRRNSWRLTLIAINELKQNDVSMLTIILDNDVWLPLFQRWLVRRAYRKYMLRMALKETQNEDQ